MTIRTPVGIRLGDRPEIREVHEQRQDEQDHRGARDAHGVAPPVAQQADAEDEVEHAERELQGDLGRQEHERRDPEAALREIAVEGEQDAAQRDEDQAGDRDRATQDAQHAEEAQRPGDLLGERVDERGVGRAVLAARLGRPAEGAPGFGFGHGAPNGGRGEG